MDKALFMSQVGKGMKVNGNRVKKMEKGHTFILMVTLTMVSGKMIKKKAGAFTYINSTKDMKVSGKMI